MDTEQGWKIISVIIYNCVVEIIIFIIIIKSGSLMVKCPAHNGYVIGSNPIRSIFGLGSIKVL